MSPSISVRDGIRFLPDSFSEPTRTLVLTSPENRFVDIRILQSPATHKGWTDERFEDALPLERLDWAFAGTSSSTISKSPGNSQIAHAQWSHWVDSRHHDAEQVSDEGDMYAMTDGRTLEKGSMANPWTGVIGEYEEVWRDVEIMGTAQRADEQQDLKRTYSVLVLENDDIPARGMVVQLGQYCQGVLRVRDEITLERWAWNSEDWKREVAIGHFLLPCGISTAWEKLPEVGGSVEYGDWRWQVVEKGQL